MSEWFERSRRVISRVHDDLPDGIALADRVKAVDAAYPFGERKYTPYKQWLKARRSYLCPYGYKPKNAPPESPMERAMRRGKARLQSQGAE